MAVKYFGSDIPAKRESGEYDDDLISTASQVKAEVEKYLEELQFAKALTSLWRLISRANKYIDETTPWVLGKDESKKDRLACVIYNLCETLRIISVLLTPFMPQTAESIQKQIGVSGEEITWDSTESFGAHNGSGKMCIRDSIRFCNRVKGCGRLVQNNKRRFFIKGTGKHQLLCLSAGQFRSVFVNRSV